ncbi:MAG TPA: hypothetical protein VGN86_03155, partial [Pyrinomonadaceae bacterium]|nr:hypothetical protein [Pyrinomonadaceae bacterium]
MVLVPLALLSAVYLYQPFRTQARLLISHGTAQSKPATDQTSTIEAATRHSTASITQEKAGDVYGRLPLSFAANRGQADSQVQFLARGAGYNLFLTSAGAVLTLHKRESRRQEPMAHRGSLRDSVAVLSMKFVGGNTNLQA